MTPAVSRDQLEQVVSRSVAEAGGFEVKSVACESGLEGKVGTVAHCDVDAGGCNCGAPSKCPRSTV